MFLILLCSPQTNVCLGEKQTHLIMASLHSYVTDPGRYCPKDCPAPISPIMFHLLKHFHNNSLNILSFYCDCFLYLRVLMRTWLFLRLVLQRTSCFLSQTLPTTVSDCELHSFFDSYWHCQTLFFLKCLDLILILILITTLQYVYSHQQYIDCLLSFSDCIYPVSSLSTLHSKLNHSNDSLTHNLISFVLSWSWCSYLANSFA